MNDEKYMYFTERIQNTLLRPEVMARMKERSGSFNSDKEGRAKRLSVNSEKELS